MYDLQMYDVRFIYSFSHLSMPRSR
jgi:hypothetical protein